jgi:hypothetical protein
MVGGNVGGVLQVLSSGRFFLNRGTGASAAWINRGKNKNYQ